MTNLTSLQLVDCSVQITQFLFEANSSYLELGLDMLNTSLRRFRQEAELALLEEMPMGVGHPLAVQEVNGCKALLLEIIRRAAYDWVLYRTSERVQHRRLADDAFNWLFVEEAGHRNWVERHSNAKGITSFLIICECLELDPEAVRTHIRKLTIKNVMSVGRPAEYRRPDRSSLPTMHNF